MAGDTIITFCILPCLKSFDTADRRLGHLLRSDLHFAGLDSKRQFQYTARGIYLRLAVRYVLVHETERYIMKLKVIIHEAEEGGYWAEVPAIRGYMT
jgi:hypothetical protein